MVRKQISLFLKNIPGELGKLTALLGDNQINIEAISIQDASSYVMELFKARGKPLKRIASSNSYQSIQRDSAEFALVRMVVDQEEKAVDLLAENDYMFDLIPVITILLTNKPGGMADVSSKFGQEGINIKYVYGSVHNSDKKVLFVFCPEDIELASKVFCE